MRNISLVFILLITLIGSCVDPLKINIDREVNVLIVEGGITTQPGPHYIKLSLSTKFDGIAYNGYLRPLENAQVLIRDSDGINHKLKEIITSYSTSTPYYPRGIIIYKSSGIYATPADFIGVVGQSYTLLITTASGIEYTSLPEEIKKGSEITELKAEFKKIPSEGGLYITGLDVYASFKDNPEEQNFYMWMNSGTYRIITAPDLFFSGGGTGLPFPAPKDCCAICWVDEFAVDKSMRLLNDININGNLTATQVAFVEDDGLRFFEKYNIKIEQHTLTREAFQFFKLLKDQLSIDGDVFDPPPATIRGNMINLSNPDENVIGYFRASDVMRDSIFLTRDMLSEAKPLLVIPNDCREFRNGTIERPSYW